MQIFNVINGRKMYDEVNPFEGVISRSINLVRVFGIIILFQIFAVEVAGSFMKTTNLRWDEWLITIAIAIIELPLGFIPRLVPVSNTVPDVIVEKMDREKRLREERVRACRDPFEVK